MRKSNWNTYLVTCYTHQVGMDPRATGGVHLHQVRCHRYGGWQVRIVDANGRWESPGDVTAIDDATGEAHYAVARA